MLFIDTELLIIISCKVFYRRLTAHIPYIYEIYDYKKLSNYKRSSKVAKAYNIFKIFLHKLNKNFHLQSKSESRNILCLCKSVYYEEVKFIQKTGLNPERVST